MSLIKYYEWSCEIVWRICSYSEHHACPSTPPESMGVGLTLPSTVTPMGDSDYGNDECMVSILAILTYTSSELSNDNKLSDQYTKHKKKHECWNNHTENTKII